MRPILSLTIFLVILASLICLPSASRADSQVIALGSSAGQDSFNQTNIPAFATNVITMAAGDTHCLALMADSTVVAWGYNELNAGET
jgi:Regulator of chromosome condensation (RCC1) repeat